MEREWNVPSQVEFKKINKIYHQAESVLTEALAVFRTSSKLKAKFYF